MILSAFEILCCAHVMFCENDEGAVSQLSPKTCVASPMSHHKLSVFSQFDMKADKWSDQTDILFFNITFTSSLTKEYIFLSSLNKPMLGFFFLILCFELLKQDLVCNLFLHTNVPTCERANVMISGSWNDHTLMACSHVWHNISECTCTLPAQTCQNICSEKKYRYEMLYVIETLQWLVWECFWRWNMRLTTWNPREVWLAELYSF